ncbi:MAG: DUF885 domain-containing protein [Chloroflexota bacterium]
MADSAPIIPTLTRPAPDGAPGPRDDYLYDLVEARFERLIRDNPVMGTYLGLHEHDAELGDGTRDALLGELEAEKAHLSAVESIDPAELSSTAGFERELEIHNLRRVVFDTEVLRVWERRSTAMDTVGDSLFLLFVRDHAPLSERLIDIASRLERVPAYLVQSQTRARGPQVRLWQQLEIEAAASLPSLFDEFVAAGEDALSTLERRRLEAAVDSAKIAVANYRSWVQDSVPGGTDDWAIGRDRYDELVGLRAFDGLDADAILELGLERLEEERAARAAAAREIDPDADVEAVVDRVKSDHPATIDEALDAYRAAMEEARRYIVEHDLLSVPEEGVDVIETPSYLRNVIPFAAYFETPKFDRHPRGIYIVTPSVNGEPGAMREHNFASVSNTSIHEAYPGHHVQLATAAKHPSLTRLLTDAPEFVEGWGMYSELMMREAGFDTDPRHRLILHTDAAWRACRIILDVRMHRGEIGLDEATRFLVEQTDFEEANARAEVHWYTYRPTYPMSYLLGRTLLVELRAEEQRRRGDRFNLRSFHDSLLRNGSLPLSFHRRVLAALP